MTKDGYTDKVRIFWQRTATLTKNNISDKGQPYWQKTALHGMDNFTHKVQLHWQRTYLLTKNRFTDKGQLFWQRTTLLNEGQSYVTYSRQIDNMWHLLKCFFKNSSCFSSYIWLPFQLWCWVSLLVMGYSLFIISLVVGYFLSWKYHICQLYSLLNLF